MPEDILDEIADGDIIHSASSPFCNDSSCPCKEDEEEINRLYQQYQDGEVSVQDRDNIYGGQGRIYNL